MPSVLGLHWNEASLTRVIVGVNVGVHSMDAEGDRLFAGESTAVFANIVADHHRDMVRLAFGLLGDADLADDVVQMAWAAAWQHRRQLRDPAKVRGWLLTITANQARKALRWQAVRRWVPFVEEPGTSSVSPELDANLDLVAALKGLPARDRLIVLLRYGLGESSSEIGRQVGLSDSGVRVRLSRILVQLRELLEND
jgi:RNA polymerase sigma factor (sigma-70 family)